MHEDELPADADLVRRLVADQFPQWADLPVEPFDTGGTTNWIFLLGDERYVRLPRRPGYVSNIEMEQVWLRRLAPQLPTQIPTPQGLGRPSADFPEPWSIYDWLPGAPATPDQQRDPAGLAVDMAEFVRSIRSIDAPDAPTPNPANAGRGRPLALAGRAGPTGAGRVQRPRRRRRGAGGMGARPRRTRVGRAARARSTATSSRATC